MTRKLEERWHSKCDVVVMIASHYNRFLVPSATTKSAIQLVSILHQLPLFNGIHPCQPNFRFKKIVYIYLNSHCSLLILEFCCLNIEKSLVFSNNVERRKNNSRRSPVTNQFKLQLYQVKRYGSDTFQVVKNVYLLGYLLKCFYLLSC